MKKCKDDNESNQLTHAIISLAQAVNHLAAANAIGPEDERLLDDTLKRSERMAKRLEALDSRTPPAETETALTGTNER